MKKIQIKFTLLIKCFKCILEHVNKIRISFFEKLANNSKHKVLPNENIEESDVINENDC